MKAYNSYSNIMFDPEAMRNTVAYIAEHIGEWQKEFGFEALVVTGKSGCALGFAVSMATGIPIVYVRKGESSHGDMIEGSGHEFTCYAVLDDFVSSGDTLARIEDEISKYCDVREIDIPHMAFVIQYQGRSVSEIRETVRVWKTGAAYPSVRLPYTSTHRDAHHLKLVPY